MRKKFIRHERRETFIRKKNLKLLKQISKKSHNISTNRISKTYKIFQIKCNKIKISKKQSVKKNQKYVK